MSGPRTTEELLALTPDEILGAFNGWLVTVARGVGFSQDWDDLIQEGRIAMWKALSSYDGKGALPKWLTYCARIRMMDVASRKKPTTRDPALSNRGHQEPPREAIYHYQRHDDESLDEEGWDLADLDAVERLAGVEWGYHSGSILRALEALSAEHRQYVVLRFWGGVEPRGPRPSGMLDRRAWADAPQTHDELAGPVDHSVWEDEIRERLAFQLQGLGDGFGDRPLL